MSRTSRFVIGSGIALAAHLTAARLPAQVVINEVLSANRFTNLDDDDDSSDWVELFNTASGTVNLAGWGLSDDETDGRKWILPEITLESGEHLLIWCSEKDRTVPRREVITRPDSPLPLDAGLIGADEEWRYLTGPPEEVEPPAGWHGLGFDDASWSSGRPPFGFGEDGVATEFATGIGAAFLRRAFRVDNPRAVPNLVFQATFDDGFIIYLNGERVADVNYFEEEEPTFASRARVSREPRDPFRVDLSDHLDLLRPGDNVLGVVLLNFRSTSNDLFLEPELGSVPPVLHANFRLAREGEVVFITDAGGQLVDGVTIPPQEEDRSYGRFPDGGGAFAYMLVPTPMGPNDSRVSAKPLPSRPEVRPQSGRHTAPFDLEIAADIPFPGFEIRLTTNGAPPGPDARLYDGPIRIARDTLVRAAGFLDGERVTAVTTKSFFGLSGASRSLALPVISISMDPRDFLWVHNTSSARGRLAEREACMEIFDDADRAAAATGFGIRLHGGAGRGGDLNTKKAYRAYFRGVYGDKKLRYPIIPDTHVREFDKLVLRSNFNDAFRTGGRAGYIRDQVIRDLHEDMGSLVSHGSWYNVFVNMRYRGVYNIVERMDKDFLASYFPEDGEDWDVIKTGNDVLDGTGVEWNRIRTFLQRSDLGDESLYREALDMIDIENFTSYMILNIWAQNHDWPHNNWYAARPQRPDGRWFFLSWDAEFGIGRNPGGFSADTFTHVFSRSGNAPASIFLNSFLRNPDYQQYFLSELDRHLEGALSPENVLERIRLQKEIVEPDMPEEAALTGNTLSTWLSSVREMETFARQRNNIIRNFIFRSNRFTFPVVTSVSPRLLVPEREEEVSVRGVRLTAATWVVFGDIPSPRVTVESSLLLKAVVPFDLRLEGRPDITVTDPSNGSFTGENLLEIRFVRPKPVELLPVRGFESGGDLVTIVGEDFTEGVRVEFGGVPAPSVTRFQQSREVLDVVTPPGRGTVEVLVINTRPGDLPAETTLSFTYLPLPEEAFRRGDADGDGSLSVSDGLKVARYITGRDPGPFCDDALDADDSGRVNITDAILLLSYLFEPGSPAPAPPFPRCGTDLSDDTLACVGPTSCR